jgi:hypothetical protein
MASASLKGVGLTLGLIGAGVLAAAAVSGALAQAPAEAASYTADGKLVFPQDYRTWVYLSSGVDMSYVEGPPSNQPMFDNVFVDPAAWAAFQKTGTWPDKAMFVLEVRGSAQKGSINKRGHFQTGLMGAEVHVKDTSRFMGGWAFFGFDGDKPAAMIPRSAACYSCHEQHAAVDTTFVQFYPTLLSIAQQKKTLSAAYFADEESAAK